MTELNHASEERGIGGMGNMIYVVLAGALLVVVVFVAAFANLFRLWMQCLLSGAAVPLPLILAMKLRRSDARLICEQRIKARQAGVELSTVQLERAYLQGADVKKLVDALLHAHRTDQNVTWEQLVETELSPDQR